MNSYKKGLYTAGMNKIISSVKIIVPVLILCLVLGLSQNALASGKFHVTAGVHVRQSASSSSKSLTTVPINTNVDVIEHDPAGWSKVQVGSITGYIRSDYLKLSIGDSPASFRTTAGVHVRETASTSAKSLTVVILGDKVDVLEHDPAGWSKVQVGSITGYIRSDFLKHAGTASGGSGSTSSGTVGEHKVVGSVNFRSSPSPAASANNIITSFSSGTVVNVLSNESNGWSKVTHNGIEGYIRTDLMTPVSASTNTQTETITRYTNGNVNFRTSPSAASTSNIIRVLSNGTAVEVISSESGWSKAIHNGTEGYIKSDWLKSASGQSSQASASTRYVNGNVNFRKSGSLSSSIIRTLKNGTAVTVLADESSGWSKVTVDGTEGYIKTDLLLTTAPSSSSGSGPVGILKVAEPKGANFREGPSTSHNIITAIPFGTPVNVLSNESNGWSRVSYNNREGYIKSDLLKASAEVELVTMAEVISLLPYRENVRIVDVRTGISFNIKIYSKGTHADYDTATKADTDLMLSTRNNVRSWAARPVWVYVGNRVFAAATHGMPHDVSWTDNGLDGHLCLHFKDTVTTNKSYQEDLRKSVLEAYDKRPR